jgi:hypothetical protein
MTDDFIQKLMIAKQVMDKTNNIPRGGVSESINVNENYNNQRISVPEVYSEQPIQAKYNVPQEYLQSTESKPITKPPVVTEDRIKNSKLPDAIKEIMLKHPIKQPEQYSATLSDDIIERASRLMGENKTITQTSSQPTSKPQSNNSDIKKIVRETVEEVLRENGLLMESESKSNETFQFRVGKHVFEGKMTKVKKLS